MRRRRSFRVPLIVACVVTGLFALSTVFAFGISTHKSLSFARKQDGWGYSTTGVGLAQVVWHHGQFHLTIDFAPVSPGDRDWTPRKWQAGAMYWPALRFDVRATTRAVSKLGFDAFLIRDNTYFSVGVVGLYPAALSWLVVWLLARRRMPEPGHCPKCGYDLRATPDRCPECGWSTPPAAAPALPVA